MTDLQEVSTFCSCRWSLSETTRPDRSAKNRIYFHRAVCLSGTNSKRPKNCFGLMRNRYDETCRFALKSPLKRIFRPFSAIYNHGWDLGPPLLTKDERLKPLKHSGIKLNQSSSQEMWFWDGKAVLLLELASVIVTLWKTYDTDPINQKDPIDKKTPNITLKYSLTWTWLPFKSTLCPPPPI